jgi:hypothetical protein
MAQRWSTKTRWLNRWSRFVTENTKPDGNHSLADSKGDCIFQGWLAQESQDLSEYFRRSKLLRRWVSDTLLKSFCAKLRLQDKIWLPNLWKTVGMDAMEFCMRPWSSKPNAEMAGSWSHGAHGTNWFHPTGRWSLVTCGHQYHGTHEIPWPLNIFVTSYFQLFMSLSN